MALRLVEQISIQHISIYDIAKVVNFKRKLNSETEYLIFNMKDNIKSIKKEKENIIKLTLDPFCLYLGAFIENHLGGLLVFRAGKNKHTGEFGMGIKKEFWGKGIGKKMIAELFKWCREKEIKKIFLKVRRDNTRAIALYEKLGFKGETVKKYYVQGEIVPYDYLIMSKIFL